MTQRRSNGPQDHVRAVMTWQGRRNDWLAGWLEMDESALAARLRGRIRWAEWEARRACRALGVPMELLFPDIRRLRPESAQPYGRRLGDEEGSPE